MGTSGLAQALTAAGYVGAADVEDALQRQVIFGGSLGTNLLEADLLSEAQLLDALGSNTGLPAVGRPHIDDIPSHVPRLLPMAFAEAYHMVPCGLEDRTLRVLVDREPDPHLLLKVRERLKLHVEPFCTSEVRLHYAMHRLYGAELTPRYRDLLIKLDGEAPRCLDDEDSPDGPPTRDRLLSWGVFSARPDTRVAGAAAKPEKLRLKPLLARLEAAPNRDAVVDVLLSSALAVFEYAGLFLVQGQSINGWRSTDPERTERIARISLPIALPSVFQTIYATQGHYLGPLPDNSVNRQFLEDIGRTDLRTAFVAPLMVGNKLAAILFADNGSRGVSPRRVAALLLLAHRSGMCLERLVRSRKAEAARLLGREPEGQGTRIELPVAERQPASEPPMPPPVPPKDAAAPAPAAAVAADGDSVSPAAAVVVEAEASAPGVAAVVEAEASAPGVAAVVEAEASAPGVAMVVEADSEAPATAVIVDEDSVSPVAVVATPADEAVPCVEVVVDEEPQTASVHAAAPAVASEGGGGIDAEAADDDVAIWEPVQFETTDPLSGDPTVGGEPRAVEAAAATTRRESSTDDGAGIPAADEPYVAFADIDDSPEESLEEWEDVLFDTAVAEDTEAGAGAASPRARGRDKAPPPTATWEDVLTELARTASIAPRAAPQTLEVAGSPVDETDMLLDSLDASSTDVRNTAIAKLLTYGGQLDGQLGERFPGRLAVDPFAPGAQLLAMADCSGLLALLVARGPEAASVVMPQLESPEPVKRFFALYFLLMVPDVRACEALARRLYDTQPQNRYMAAEALRRHSREPAYQRIVEGLREQLKVPVLSTQVTTVQVLGQLREPTAVPSLIPLVVSAQQPLAEAVHSALAVLCAQAFGAQLGAWQQWWQTHFNRPRPIWLLEGLEHPHAGLRRLAHAELQSLTGSSIPFDPEASLPQRQQGIAAWRSRLGLGAEVQAQGGDA